MQQGSAMISPNSFCGFIFTRPIDVNLDLPFLYNPLNQNVKTIWFIIRKRLSSTQGSAMISPNSFCGFVFTRAIDMNLDPPFLQNSLDKNEETNLNYYSETVEFYTRFCNDISQLILWICLRKGHRYELRPAIPAKFSGQEWRNQFELLLGNGWVLHKVLKWYLPTHSVDLYSPGP